MASGDTLLTLSALSATVLSSAGATRNTRNTHHVLEFDDTTDESVNWQLILPRHYAGGGITVYIHWAGATATSGNVVWEVSFERIGEGSQDVDSDSFASIQYVQAAAPGTSGNVDIASIAFTNGAQIDSIAVGELVRLKLSRDANGTNATDDMTGDAQVFMIELKET